MNWDDRMDGLESPTGPIRRDRTRPRLPFPVVAAGCVALLAASIVGVSLLSGPSVPPEPVSAAAGGHVRTSVGPVPAPTTPPTPNIGLDVDEDGTRTTKGCAP